MKSSDLAFWALIIVGLSTAGLGCGSDSDPAPSATELETPNGYTLPPLSGPNVLALTVNGANCSANSYFNKPCVSIKICEPGNSSHCQTINDILLDTGSFGVRIFSQAVDPSLLSTLTAVTKGTNPIAECVQYGDGSKDWGPIKNASVILGEEPAVDIPIQIIDSTFGNASSVCSGAETGPSTAGFNGILGVGFFSVDCGTSCANRTTNGLYYECSGSTCTGTSVPLDKQVHNPVAALPTDNNGVILELPRVPLLGQESANGYLVLGIATQANNTPKNEIPYFASPTTGDFSTRYQSQTYDSFLDSGSNGLFFPGALTNCGTFTSNLSGWFCPPTTSVYTASNISYSGSKEGAVAFQIGNILDFKQDAHVFIEIGGDIGLNLFDWGLPFFLGRNVYVGFADTTSPLGTGPYWAY